jgi:hypothetical protein
MDLPHSDAPFIKAYPAEVAEAFVKDMWPPSPLWRRPAVDPV